MKLHTAQFVNWSKARDVGIRTRREEVSPGPVLQSNAASETRMWTNV